MFQDLQTENFQSLPQLFLQSCLPKHAYFYAKEVIFLFFIFYFLLFVFKDRERGAEGKKYLAHFGNGLLGVPQPKYVGLQCTDLRKRNNAGGEKI